MTRSPSGQGTPMPRDGACERTLVLGLGNDILTDDRVGLLASRELAAQAPLVAVEEACLCNLDLLPIIEGYDRVVILDAIWGQAWEAGRVYRFTPADLPHSFGYRSPHTMDLSDMLAMGRDMGLQMPKQIIVLALGVVDPFTFGEELTPAVREGLPGLVDAARSELGAGE